MVLGSIFCAGIGFISLAIIQKGSDKGMVIIDIGFYFKSYTLAVYWCFGCGFSLGQAGA
jgi:hypothetical protein